MEGIMVKSLVERIKEVGRRYCEYVSFAYEVGNEIADVIGGILGIDVRFDLGGIGEGTNVWKFECGNEEECRVRRFRREKEYMKCLSEVLREIDELRDLEFDIESDIFVTEEEAEKIRIALLKKNVYYEGK